MLRQRFGSPAEACRGVGESREGEARHDGPCPPRGADLAAHGRPQVARYGARQHLADVATFRSEAIPGSCEPRQHGLGRAFNETADRGSASPEPWRF
jgi:hypothetical protein